MKLMKATCAPAGLALLLTLVGGCQASRPAPAPGSGSGASERDIVFRNGDVALHGTVMWPAGDGPAPAVVFIHGSGPATRAGARRYAEAFAELGIASLFFDKRGSGESGGSWVRASLDDLAGDALAAIDYLQGQDGIDPDRIGLWGVSQAGWVGPRAAARSDDVAFMILVSGGGVTPRESELFSYEHHFESAGLPEAERAVARSILNDYFDFLATGDGRDDVVGRVDSIRGGPLAPLAEQLDQIMVSEANRPNWAWVGGYDPAADLAEVDVPVLLLFGDRDRQHPTDAAVAGWRAGLERAGNRDATLRIFQGAGHGIRMGEHRGAFADGYLEAQLDWLREEGLARP